MGTITITINSRTKKAKHLIGLIEELAKTEKGIDIFEVPVPNSTTRRAMKEAETGKTHRAKSADELFNGI